MSYVTVKDLMADAERNEYAVGGFNLNNMEILQAVIQAAEEERSPVILQASQGGIKYAGISYIVAMAKAAAERATVPVALNLDHGTSFEQVVSCICSGFSAVMIDGSSHSFESNIALTRRVVEVARIAGVSVEGELGKIGGTEDDISVDDKDALMTNPNDAEIFVEQTDVDLLAIAIGTAHGVYMGKPELDFERLKVINEKIDVPIVLHGASGVSDEDVRKAISLGVRKINIDTELRLAFSNAVRQVIDKYPNEIDPRKILGPARENMKEVVKHKMRVFGSSGRV
jgi:fructose-bisphosphate aldolase class II